MQRIRPSTWVVVGVLAFLAILVLVFGFPFRIHRGITIKNTATMLNLNLRRGTEADKVVAFLDARGIEHSPYHRGDHDIRAIRRNVCLVLLLECSIEIQFALDGNGHLEKTSISEDYTGL